MATTRRGAPTCDARNGACATRRAGMVAPTHRTPHATKDDSLKPTRRSFGLRGRGEVTGARSPKVLVVDDERSILYSTCALLDDMGDRAVGCAEASQIRAAIDRERPDLVLQDVRMPGLDLERLVVDVRRDPSLRGLPFVVFTASMDAEEIRDRIQAAGFLDKPFHPADLQTAIDIALRGAGAEAA